MMSVGNNLVRGCQWPAPTKGNLLKPVWSKGSPGRSVCSVWGHQEAAWVHSTPSLCSCFRGTHSSRRKVWKHGWLQRGLLHLETARQRCYSNCRRLGSWERWIVAVRAETQSSKSAGWGFECTEIGEAKALCTLCVSFFGLTCGICQHLWVSLVCQLSGKNLVPCWQLCPCKETWI